MSPTEEFATARLDLCIFDREGVITMRISPWDGTRITFLFEDSILHTSGVIEFDGASGAIQIHTADSCHDRMPGNLSFRDYFSLITNHFLNFYSFGWVPPATEKPVEYDTEYHTTFGYLKSSPEEQAIKTVQAQIIQRFANPRKLLIAGCSGGELVRQCRARGMDAFGFDIIPNLAQVAFDDVRTCVREGSLSAIPFAATDGFDTLVAIDVFEHIPENVLPTVLQEWLRLGIKKLVLLTHLNNWGYPGHITLRPLEWWDAQWAPHFRRTRTERFFADLPRVYSNNDDYNRQWTLWECAAARSENFADKLFGLR